MKEMHCALLFVCQTKFTQTKSSRTNCVQCVIRSERGAHLQPLPIRVMSPADTGYYKHTCVAVTPVVPGRLDPAPCRSGRMTAAVEEAHLRRECGVLRACGWRVKACTGQGPQAIRACGWMGARKGLTTPPVQWQHQAKTTVQAHRSAGLWRPQPRAMRARGDTIHTRIFRAKAFMAKLHSCPGLCLSM